MEYRRFLCAVGGCDRKLSVLLPSEYTPHPAHFQASPDISVDVKHSLVTILLLRRFLIFRQDDDGDSNRCTLLFHLRSCLRAIIHTFWIQLPFLRNVRWASKTLAYGFFPLFPRYSAFNVMHYYLPMLSDSILAMLIRLSLSLSL